MATNTDPDYCPKCHAWHSPGIHWPSYFSAHGDDALKAFGYPEEGSRNVGTVEELYQHIKARLIAELQVDVHGTTHYGRLLERESSEDSGA
jgi:hypothetical protein